MVLRRRRNLLVLPILIVVGILMIWRGWQQSQPQSSVVAGGDLRLVRAVDGDTIDVQEHGVSKTIRLIGINTPETVDPRKPVQCYGHEASDHTKQLTAQGIARLEIDPLVGDTDKYGRELRYVWLADGKMLNRELVADGYAYEYTYQSQPYSYQAEFKSLAKQAQTRELGLWSPSTCNGKL